MCLFLMLSLRSASLQQLACCKQHHRNHCPSGKKNNRGKKRATFSSIIPTIACTSVPCSAQQLSSLCYVQVSSFFKNFLFLHSSYPMSSCSQKRGKLSLYRSTPEKKCRGQIDAEYHILLSCRVNEFNLLLWFYFGYPNLILLEGSGSA